MEETRAPLLTEKNPQEESYTDEALHILDQDLLVVSITIRIFKYKDLEKETGWRFIFYANVFFCCVTFSILLPSLWPYL
jgi:hypothetical protein